MQFDRSLVVFFTFVLVFESFLAGLLRQEMRFWYFGGINAVVVILRYFVKRYSHKKIIHKQHSYRGQEIKQTADKYPVKSSSVFPKDVIARISILLVVVALFVLSPIAFAYSFFISVAAGFVVYLLLMLIVRPVKGPFSRLRPMPLYAIALVVSFVMFASHLNTSIRQHYLVNSSTQYRAFVSDELNTLGAQIVGQPVAVRTGNVSTGAASTGNILTTGDILTGSLMTGYDISGNVMTGIATGIATTGDMAVTSGSVTTSTDTSNPLFTKTTYVSQYELLPYLIVKYLGSGAHADISLSGLDATDPAYPYFQVAVSKSMIGRDINASKFVNFQTYAVFLGLLEDRTIDTTHANVVDAYRNEAQRRGLFAGISRYDYVKGTDILK